MKKLAFGLFLSALVAAPAAVEAQKPCCGEKPAQKPAQKAAEKPKTGCTTCELAGTDTSPRATLTIRWKRLVLGKDKKTAPQHAAAEQAVDRAFATLQKSLAPVGVEVSLQKAGISEERFKKDPMLSNRLWINGAALEMHLPKAKTGKVVDKTTGVAFRTVEFAGKSFRDIPADMIVQAGLIAAGESVKQALAEVHVLATAGNGCGVGGQPAAPKPKGDCCEKPEGAAKPKAGCCEKPEEPAKPKGGCCEKPKEPAKPKGGCCEKPVETSATKNEKK